MASHRITTHTDIRPAGELPGYLSDLAAQLHGPRRVREAILTELRDGLDHATEDHIAAGLLPDRATTAALGKMPEGVDGLTSDDFGKPEHMIIWGAMIAQPDHCDLTSVLEYLDKHGNLKRGVLKASGNRVGDLYLTELMEAPVVEPAHSASIVKEHSIWRQLADMAAGFTQRATQEVDLGEVVRRAEEKLSRISASLDGQRPSRFKIGSFADIAVQPSTFLLPGLPDEELVPLVGEEGIGKGLYCVDCIARVTQAGHNVLIIATEDDYKRVLKPRLDVAGADTSRCFFVTSDLVTLQGQPTFPHDIPEVRAMIRRHNIRLIYIDPWVSSVSAGLRLRDPQDARRAIDPLVSLAQSEHCTIIAVAHTNRTEGDLRAKVGLTAELRKASRWMMFALEPPDDDSKIIVGVEKANNGARGPATVYNKVPHAHPELPKQKVYAIEETDALPLTVRQWYDRYRPDRDHRLTDRWPEVQAKATENKGLITRSDIVAIYTKDGSTESAADKAITRWLSSEKLLKQGSGVYEIITED